MKILVTGATGRTGLEIVRQAFAEGHEVTALVRDEATAAASMPGARLVVGDGRDAAALARAVKGNEAVVSALGTRKVTLVRRVTVNSESTRTLVDAMRNQGVSRLVCITGLGAGDSAGHGGFMYDGVIKPLILRTIYEDKDRQEAVVRASGLDWILVRPTILTDRPANGRIRATTDLSGFHGGSIPRADVAAFVIAQLGSDRWLRRTPLITTDRKRDARFGRLLGL